LKLDKKRKKRVSVLDYTDAFRNNEEVWKRVSLKKNDISITWAFDMVEKVDKSDNFETLKRIAHLKMLTPK